MCCPRIFLSTFSGEGCVDAAGVEVELRGNPFDPFDEAALRFKVVVDRADWFPVPRDGVLFLEGGEGELGAGLCFYEET